MSSRVAIVLGLAASLTACGGATRNADKELATPDDAQLCTGVEFPAELWTKTIRERVSASIIAAAGDAEDPERIAERVLASLDQSALHWTQLRRQACMAAHELGPELGEPTLAKNDACLLASLAWREAIVETALAPPSVASIGALELNVLAMDVETELCLHPTNIQAFEPRTAQSGIARDAIARARAYRWFELHDDAQRTAQQAVDAAAEGPPGLRAEAMLELAWTLVEGSDRDGADQDAAAQVADASLHEAETIGHELGVASARHVLARAAYGREDYAEAISIYRKVVHDYERLLGPNRPEIAGCLNDLAMAQVGAGELDQAQTTMHRATRLMEALLGQDHPITAIAYHNFAYVLDTQSELELARTYYQRSLEIRTRVLGREHPNTLAVVHDLGTVLMSAKRCEDAIPILEQAVQSRQRVLGEADYQTGLSHYNLGAAQLDCELPDASQSSFERALAIFSESGGPLDVANVLEYLATIHMAQGRPDQALAALGQVVEIRMRELGATHPDTADAHLAKAGIHHSQGQIEQALSGLRAALPAYEQAEPRDEAAIRFLRAEINYLCSQVPGCGR